MATKRQTLSVDLDQLFPGESLEIGGQSVIIRPLNIEQIATITKQLKGFGSILSEEGVTWENYKEPAYMFKIAVVILENFSDVLEEASNIDISDLKKLTLELIVKIVEKVISVNIKSKDNLEKNFKSLAKMFPQETPKKEKKGSLKKIKTT